MCRKQTLSSSGAKTELSRVFKRQILRLEHQLSRRYNTKTKESNEAFMMIYLTTVSSRKSHKFFEGNPKRRTLILRQDMVTHPPLLKVSKEN